MSEVITIDPTSVRSKELILGSPPNEPVMIDVRDNGVSNGSGHASQEVVFNEPLHPVASAIRDRILAVSPDELLEGEGKRSRLTEVLKTGARDSFFDYMADAGSPEELENVLNELRTVAKQMERGPHKVALHRFVNALRMRLQHFNAGHEVAGSSSPLALDFLVENLPEPDPVTGEIELLQGGESSETPDSEERAAAPEEEPVNLAEVMPQVEIARLPDGLDAQQQEQLVEVLTAAPVEEQQPVQQDAALAVVNHEPEANREALVTASTTVPELESVEQRNPIAAALEADPLFAAESYFAVDPRHIDQIAEHVSAQTSELARIHTDETRPWYTRLARRIDPEIRTRTEMNEHALARYYPSTPEQNRHILARQMATILPGITADVLTAGELAAFVRTIQLTQGQPDLSRPRDPNRRQQVPRRNPDGTLTRRAFLTGAAALALGAGAEVVRHAVTGRSILDTLWSLNAIAAERPVGPTPVPADAPTGESPAEATAREAARLAAERARLDAEAKAEAEKAEAERLASAQEAEARAKQAKEERVDHVEEVTQQQQEQAERRHAEAKEAFLSTLKAVRGRGLVIAGEQGNFVGDYGDLTEQQMLDDEIVNDLVEVQQLFNERRAEFNNHLRITIGAGTNANLEIANFDANLKQAERMKNSGEHSDDPDWYQKQLASITETIPIAPSADMGIEVSAVELVGDRVKLRWENTYVGDGKVLKGEKSGALFLDLSAKEAKELLQGSEKGTSTAFFATSTEAYVHNVGNSMRLIGDHCQDLRDEFDAIDATHLAAPLPDMENVYKYVWGKAIVDHKANGAPILGDVIAGGACGGLSPSWNEIIRTLDAAGVTYNILQHQNHSAFGGYTPGHAEPSTHRDDIPMNQWREATMYAGVNTKFANGRIGFDGALSMHFEELYRTPAEGNKLAKGLFVLSGNAVA